jgi:hypothetical protein
MFFSVKARGQNYAPSLLEARAEKVAARHGLRHAERGQPDRVQMDPNLIVLAFSAVVIAAYAFDVLCRKAKLHFPGGAVMVVVLAGAALLSVGARAGAPEASPSPLDVTVPIQDPVEP